MPTISAFYIHRSYAVRESGTKLSNSLTPCDALIDATDCNQLVLYVDFTKGSLTEGTLEIEFGNDKSTWYGYTWDDEATGSGVIYTYRKLYNFTASLRYRIEVHPVMDKWIRIRVAGTGDTTGSDMNIEGYVGTA